MGKILLINTAPEGKTAEWAGAAAERIDEYQVAAVYVCPVPGAGETARIVAEEGGVPVKALPGFDETVEAFWKAGSKVDGPLLDCNFKDVPPGAIPELPFNAEIDDLRARIGQALDAIAEAHKKENVAVVSHRALTVVMIMHLLHMDGSHYRQLAQDYGAANLFEVRGGIPSALYINDICHLFDLR